MSFVDAVAVVVAVVLLSVTSYGRDSPYEGTMQLVNSDTTASGVMQASERSNTAATTADIYERAKHSRRLQLQHVQRQLRRQRYQLLAVETPRHTTPSDMNTAGLRQVVRRHSGGQLTSLTDVSATSAAVATDVCWNFTVGDLVRQEFQSPSSYHQQEQQKPRPVASSQRRGHVTDRRRQQQQRVGSHYPYSTDCFRLLSAPTNHRIRLDFRDEFQIEVSENCAYDYLEIRDGPFGYSPLIGRYCGSKHPPLIQSTGRYLWLAFHSDDSIEYDGFRVVYEFVQNPRNSNRYNSAASTDLRANESQAVDHISSTTPCRLEVDTYTTTSGIVSSTDIPTSYLESANRTASPVDCTWVFNTPSSVRVFIHWSAYKMTTPQICWDSYLEYYESTTSPLHRLQTYCVSTPSGGDRRTNSNTAYLRLYSVTVDRLPHFTVVYSAVSPGPCDITSQFDCGDQWCVSSSLVCNGQINCNRSMDELNCTTDDNSRTELVVPETVRSHTVIVGVLFGAVLTIAVVAVCASCHQTRREKHRMRKMTSLPVTSQDLIDGNCRRCDSQLLLYEMPAKSNNTSSNTYYQPSSYRGNSNTSANAKIANGGTAIAKNRQGTDRLPAGDTSEKMMSLERRSRASASSSGNAHLVGVQRVENSQPNGNSKYQQVSSEATDAPAVIAAIATIEKRPLSPSTLAKTITSAVFDESVDNNQSLESEDFIQPNNVLALAASAAAASIREHSNYKATSLVTNTQQPGATPSLTPQSNSDVARRSVKPGWSVTVKPVSIPKQNHRSTSPNNENKSKANDVTSLERAMTSQQSNVKHQMHALHPSQILQQQPIDNERTQQSQRLVADDVTKSQQHLKGTHYSVVF